MFILCPEVLAVIVAIQTPPVSGPEIIVRVLGETAERICGP